MCLLRHTRGNSNSTLAASIVEGKTGYCPQPSVLCCQSVSRNDLSSHQLSELASFPTMNETYYKATCLYIIIDTREISYYSNAWK